jgi:hypothetical protein
MCLKTPLKPNSLNKFVVCVFFQIGKLEKKYGLLWSARQAWCKHRILNKNCPVKKELQHFFIS